ncbi:glycosyltransferase [Zhihengliuella sp.]|uniref:glycosyltransferase n=1 Tax=Zhihengliuella sp. TaxID=1954483 RepID=UPI002810AB5D|nr:glycosyltransferase [Zhihengliuella sp.]
MTDSPQGKRTGPLHIAVFVDQHPHTLGGMQTSVLLQQKFLERLGHRVTIVGPGTRGAAGSRAPVPAWRAAARADVAAAVRRVCAETADHRGTEQGHHVVGLPGLPLGRGEYSLNVPSRRLDRRLDEAMAGLPPVDVVHVQGDFWGAVLAYRYARRHGAPVVHTMHNRLDVGLAATVPFPRIVQGAFGAGQKLFLRLPGPVPADAWSYLRGFTDAAAAVTAPSTHFADLLERENVFSRIDVVPTGLDDDVAASLMTPGRAAGAEPAGAGAGAAGTGSVGAPEAGSPRPRLRLVWTGRFSPEKRLLPFLEAVLAAGEDVDVDIFGDGAQRGRAEAMVAGQPGRDTPSTGGGPRFRFRGRVPYEQMLAELASADVLVQTSVGFETQGMTVFEAAALGTPTVLSDHRIAADLPDGSYWLTPDSTVHGLAESIRSAVAQLRSGLRWEATEADQLLQSRQTTKMLEIYRRVLA